MKENILNKITDSIESYFLKLFNKIGLKNFTKWYEKNKTSMRYLIFGGLTTLVNILTFELLINYYSTIISNTFAWLFSIIFAYITNKFCVFYSFNNNFINLIKEIFSFVFYRILTLVIDEVFMYLTVDIFSFNSFFMKIISNIIVIVLNYIFSKMLIFKNRKKY